MADTPFGPQLSPDLIRAQAPYDPYAGDGTPSVYIVVNGNQIATRDYMMISDMLVGCGDPLSLTVPNPDGSMVGKVNKGDLIEMYIADPNVAGGQSTRQMTGRVISVDYTSTMQGSTMRVTAADLGWHLQNSAAPVFMSLQGQTIGALANKLLNSSWGIKGVKFENATNIKARLGRRQAALNVTPAAYPAVLPRIQVEPGQNCADVLFYVCKLNQILCQVTQDGYLAFYQPDYHQEAAYTFNYYASDNPNRRNNNVLSVSVSDSIQGIYTKTKCYTTTLIPASAFVSNSPNEGAYSGSDTDPDALPFDRTITFGDSEALNKKQANARANWKRLRGVWDSFQYQVEVFGHSQNGNFYVPGCMAVIVDEVHQISGRFYVQSVSWERTIQGGTKTKLTLRKPVLPTGGF